MINLQKNYKDAFTYAMRCGLNSKFANSYAKTLTEDPHNVGHVKTTKGNNLTYFIDWNVTEGCVVMLNAKTLSTYNKIHNAHPKDDECGIFFAFNEKQFNDGYNHLVELGFIKDGDKLQVSDLGAYGTKESLDKFFGFYANRDKDIPKICDPQEVYFLEYNNHECMYAWDGDKDAYNTIVELFGEEVAKTIKRL